MVFIDLIPEVLFVGIYLLIVVSWGTIWVKSRGLAAPRSFLTLKLYTLIMGILFAIAAVLAIVARVRGVKYAVASVWESIFILSLTCLSVVVCLVIGMRIYFSFRYSEVVDYSRSKFLKRLNVLIVLTLVSFVLKGFWSYFFNSYASSVWRNGGMPDVVYGTLWYLYYFVSELLPETCGLVFRYLHNNDTSASGAKTIPLATRRWAHTTSTSPVSSPLNTPREVPTVAPFSATSNLNEETVIKLP